MREVSSQVIDDAGRAAWYYALGRMQERDKGRSVQTADLFAEFVRERMEVSADNLRLTISQHWEEFKPLPGTEA